MPNNNNNNNNLSSSAQFTLKTSVEEHLIKVIQTSITLQRKSKRARYNGHGSRARIHLSDVNLALQMLGNDKLYLTNNAAVVNNSQQQPVGLQSVLSSKQDDNMMVPPPTEVSLHMNWLAVDGVPTTAHTTTTAATSKRGRGGGGGTLLLDPIPNIATSGVATDQTTSPSWIMDGNNNASSLLQVHQLLDTLVSEELKLFYQKVTKQNRDQVYLLQTTSGIQELLPFLIQYANFQMMMSPSQNAIFGVTMIQHLLCNQHVHLELQLQLILPKLMTCAIGRHQGSSDDDVHAQHGGTMINTQLRQAACDVLYLCCQVFSDNYPILKTRILKQYCQALTLSNHVGQVYGGMVGITCFGKRAISSLLVPQILQNWDDLLVHHVCLQQAALHAINVLLLPSYYSGLDDDDASLEDGEGTSTEEQQDHHFQFRRMLTSTDDDNNTTNIMDYQNLVYVLGDRITAITGQANIYNMCFI